MDKERIKAEADSFFEWPDPKRRDHVTLTSCLIFAEVIAGMAVEAERRRMRDIYEAEFTRLRLQRDEAVVSAMKAGSPTTLEITGQRGTPSCPVD